MHGIAQEDEPAPQIAYYLAADADGVQQVYQHLLDGQSAPRQLTRAESDVITFNAAHDGLSVVYISGGQLWLQPIHTDAPEALAPVGASHILRQPRIQPWRPVCCLPR
ncbi:MAG: hypothetical protein M5R40_02325 [Anaerolineae bacterium]|nr:hypothetical protein [Anaerolineae bacterium]